MNRISTLFTLMIVSCSIEKEQVDDQKTIHVDEKDVIIIADNQTFPWKIEKTDFSFAYTGEVTEFGFVTGNDTSNFKVFPSDTLTIHFVLNKKDTIEVTAIGQSNPATFDKDYIENTKGKYQVFSPEVHELINISAALTHIGRQDSNMIYMKSAYYNEMVSHFHTYKNHPLLDSLNQNMMEAFSNSSYDYYLNLRMNACMYAFDGHKIVNNSPYNRLGFGGDNRLEALIPLFEDFARKSGFEEFYRDHADYYQSLIDSYYELVPIDEMWDWIEKKFPQRYESYKIYFSPLIGGVHSTQKLSDKGFKETIMFINAPIFTRNYPEKYKEAVLSRIIFTEIDHNYVNPTTDKFPEMHTIMEPLTCWNNGAQGYGNSYATFNEYMTWAVFTLYLYDNFDKEIFEKRNKIESGFMTNRRGFVKFKAFNEFVLDWYVNNANKSFEDLYPDVIKWIEGQNCQ